MRVLVLVVLAFPVAARADSFADVLGGFSIPLGDSNWTKTAGPSPELQARAGSLSGDVGGMLQVDWTAINLDAGGGSSPVGSVDTTGHRFRILADVAFQHRVAPRISLSARGGAGVDIAYGSYSVAILGTTSSHSNTDVGFGFELGGGVWFDLSPTVQLGGELAVPIAHHSKQAQNVGDITFDYTSYDLDLLFGVRVR